MGAVVCYDCTDSESLRNAETWMKDFEEKARADAPKILVSCKKDKRVISIVAVMAAPNHSGRANFNQLKLLTEYRKSVFVAIL